VPSNYAAGSTTIYNSKRSFRQRAKVPVRTIDSLASMLGIANIDWIKIDVEGAEIGVLTGSKNVIRNHKPKMIIETMNERVVQFLRERGYNVLPVTGVIGLVYAHPILPPAGIAPRAFDQQTVAN
jgi:hypothetical protein